MAQNYNQQPPYNRPPRESSGMGVVLGILLAVVVAVHEHEPATAPFFVSARQLAAIRVLRDFLYADAPAAFDGLGARVYRVDVISSTVCRTRQRSKMDVKLGAASAARTARMATVTISSTAVKPREGVPGRRRGRVRGEQGEGNDCMLLMLFVTSWPGTCQTDERSRNADGRRAGVACLRRW